jgi:hypothetical protein
MDYKRFFPAVLEMFVNRISYYVCRSNSVLLKLGYILVNGYFAEFNRTQQMSRLYPDLLIEEIL